MGKSRGAMGGTEGQIYIPLGRKEEGKVDMVQQKSHGSHGKRAKLAIGLICGVALLAGMALLTHEITTGDTKQLVTKSLSVPESEDKSDLARSMDSWILERLATEVEALKEEVARKNNQTAEMATGVEGLKEEVVKLKASTCTVEENMDYWGSDITGQMGLPADDKDMCILLCAEEVRCSYWTYITGRCWLKTSDSGRKGHPTAISGSRGCVGMATGVKALKDEVSQLKELFGPSPWTLLSAGCYLFDTPPRNWTDANQFCKGRFSKLIEVETNQENDALVEEIIRKDWNSLKLEPWLGLTDLKNVGTFLWSSSGQEANYTNWHPGQPNNAGGNEHCAHYGGTNQWSDRQCDLKLMAYDQAVYGYVAVCEKI